MKKIINNRIIAFIVYLILFLLILYLGSKQDSLLRFILLSFYCVLIVEIQSKSRVIKNKISWIFGMFLFSPIAFPLFLISDKKYFKKIAVVGGINIVSLIIVLYLWGQSLQVYDSLVFWDKNDAEIQEIDKQYADVKFDNLTEESSNFVVDLSNKKLEKLNNIYNSIETIKNNIFVKSSTEQSVYYEKWSGSLKHQITTMNMYLDVFKAIKEKQPINDTNKLISNWKIEDEKINTFKIDSVNKQLISKSSFKSANTVSVLVSIVFILLLANIFFYIKLFGLKTWKLIVIFGLDLILNLLLSLSVFLIGY